MCVQPDVVAPEAEMEALALNEVMEAEPVSELVDRTKVPAPVEMMEQDVCIDAADKEVAQSDLNLQEERMSTEAASESQPSSALMNSFISIDAKTPKQLYYEQVQAESDATLQEALKNLYESGFTDFRVNKALMLKLKDINAVANQLLTGALNESQFNAILE